MKREEQEGLEEKYKALFETAPDGVAFVDSEGIIREVNEKACEFLECSKEDLVGKPLTEQPFYSGKDRDKFLKRAEKVFEGDSVPSTTYELETKEGEKRYIEMNNSVIKENGDFKGLVLIARDITELKKANESLRGEKERYRVLTEESDSLIAEFNLEGDYLFANKGHERILGYEPEKLIGKNVFNFIPQEDRNQVKEEFEKKKKKKRGKIETRFRAKNGSYRWVEIHGRIIPQSKKILGVSHDITKRKEIRKRDKSLNSLLRHTIKDKANIIRGYQELLKDHDLAEETENKLVEKLEKTRQDIVKIANKVNTLLKVHDVETEEVSVNSVLDVPINKTKTQASEKGIEIKYEKTNCRVKGGSLLEDLFYNLIENSILHSNCSKIRITTTEENDECMISIEDNGKGIPDKYKEKIFDKGYKKGENAGTGLGMYLVREIAETYNGNVEVKDSELGGARFDIHLQKA